MLETHEYLTAAQQFYEANGYELTGTTTDQQTDTDRLHYHKRLRSPA